MTIYKNCPICDGGEAKYLGSKNNINILKCKMCTHVFADLGNYDFEKEDLDEFRGCITNGLMPSDFEYYQHLLKGEGIGYPTHITATKIINIVKSAGIERGKWFDIGSGSGHLVERVNESGFDVIGLEPGGWGQIASSQKNISINQGFLDKNNSKELYKIVSATDVVEHVANPYEFIKMMSSYVSEDGFIVLSVPCYDSFEAMLFGMEWQMIAPPTHRHFFTKASIKLLIDKLNLKMIKVEQFNIRRLLGLSKYTTIRNIVDYVFAGDQLVCLIKCNH